MTDRERQSPVVQAIAPEAANGRFSMAQCRELLPPGYEIEDCELGRVRDALYALAEVTLDGTRDLCARREIER